MKDETTMSAAFAKVGVDRNEQRLYADMARFINNGGTVARIHALADIAAERMPGGDHIQDVRKDQNCSVPAGQPQAGGRGQGSVDREVQERIAPPARAPSRADRKATIAAARESAKAVLDLGWIGRAGIPAGPAYVDIRNGEVLAFRKRQVREGVNHARAAVVMARFHSELEKLGQVDHEAKTVETLGPAIVRRISAETEMAVLGPMAKGWLEGFIETSELTIAGGGNG